MFILSAPTPEQIGSLSNQGMSSGRWIHRLWVQFPGREQLVYSCEFRIYLVGTGRFLRRNSRTENHRHSIQLGQRCFSHTLMSVGKLRPMPPTRHWHTEFPTGLSKCDRGNAIFLRDLQHRLLPDLLIEFLPIILLHGASSKMRTLVRYRLSGLFARLTLIFFSKSIPSRSNSIVTLGSQSRSVRRSEPTWYVSSGFQTAPCATSTPRQSKAFETSY